MERIYRPLPEIDDKEIKRIMQEGTIDELIILPLSVGMYYPEWKIAQDICLKLSDHEDERVRANTALGLSYVAHAHHRLDKHLVKPVLLKLLNDCSEYQWRIIDALEDINLFMNWHIGEKAMERIENDREG